MANEVGLGHGKVVPSDAPITTARLSLVAMTAELLEIMLDGRGDRGRDRPFRWPAWWPDEGDREHLAVWWNRAAAADANVAWGPRAIVSVRGQMLGHAGFHLPPRPIEAALDDPTYAGTRDPVDRGVVEIGYKLFPEHRHRGYATETVRALLDWAALGGEVGAALAAVAHDNDASVRVLERVGGFVAIGTCRAGDTIEVVYRRDL